MKVSYPALKDGACSQQGLKPSREFSGLGNSLENQKIVLETFGNMKRFRSNNVKKIRFFLIFDSFRILIFFYVIIFPLKDDIEFHLIFVCF
jgi:hypothetical protein